MNMPLSMKVRSPGSKKLKRRGVGRSGEPGAPQHTVAVPVNPLPRAGGLHSCLSQAGTALPAGLLPGGPGGSGWREGEEIGGQHGG